MADTWPKKPQHHIITLDRHLGLFMTWPIVLPGVAWHIGYAQEGWSKTVGENKWNDDVLADGVPIASLGNCPEMCLVPHLNLFPFPPWHPNLLIPILILGSSSKSFIAVGSVVAKQGPIAVSLPFVKVIGMNLACNDPVTMPTDVVIMPSSTVVLGFTLGDLIAALLRYGLQLAIDFVLEWLGKKLGSLADKARARLGKRFASSNNAFGRWMSRTLDPPKALREPPGRFKRAALDWMGDRGINKTYRDLDTGRFRSVFDDVTGKYRDAALDQLHDLTGIPTSMEQVVQATGLPANTKDVYGILEDRLVGPDTNLVDAAAGDIGAFIDGRSEMLLPSFRNPFASP
jgi:hypothetical protein